VEKFIIDHFDEFMEGYKTEDVRAAKPSECCSEKAFVLAISGKCRRVRRRVGGSSPYFYVLKDEWKEFYKPADHECTTEGDGGIEA
jgi:hypothetical protein